MPEPRTPLVSVDWLAAHLHDVDLRIVDVRWYLGGRRGADAYAEGHVPGAAFMDLDTELAAPKGAGLGRHPLPRAEAFADVLARLGVTRGTTLVAYDDAGGAIASRLWWLLRHFGHDGGRVLDGGLPAWTAAGLPIATELPRIEPVEPMRLAPARDDVVDRAFVAAHAGTRGTVVLDARAAERFEGKLEPIDARPGHVPGARSAPFAGNLLAPGGPFLAPEQLVARYEALGALSAERVVCYCGSGVTACHDLLALALAGRDDALLYEGSWSDWAADASLAAAIGPDE